MILFPKEILELDDNHSQSSQLLASKKSSEFTSGRGKRISEFLGGPGKRDSEGPEKRVSEFLGGPGKRISEFLGGPGKRTFELPERSSLPIFGIRRSKFLANDIRPSLGKDYYLVLKMRDESS